MDCHTEKSSVEFQGGNVGSESTSDCQQISDSQEPFQNPMMRMSETLQQLEQVGAEQTSICESCMAQAFQVLVARYLVSFKLSFDDKGNNYFCMTANRKEPVCFVQGLFRLTIALKPHFFAQAVWVCVHFTQAIIHLVNLSGF